MNSPEYTPQYVEPSELRALFKLTDARCHRFHGSGDSPFVHSSGVLVLLCRYCVKSLNGQVTIVATKMPNDPGEKPVVRRNPRSTKARVFWRKREGVKGR